MKIPTAPKESTIDLFKTELWKDQRRLDTKVMEGRDYLVKHYSSEEDARFEARLLRHLFPRLTVARVPEVVEESQTSITIPYIRGIRVFNLLVELDRLDPPYASLGLTIKRRLIERCEANQKDIQGRLIEYMIGEDLKPYPVVEKIEAIIRILSESLGIVVDFNLISKELEQFSMIWAQSARIPFRDATTKNMVLNEPTLWLGAFDSEESRRQYLLKTLKQSDEPYWLSAPVFDFDFSSCSERSTPEDDPISLKCHERTWVGQPNAADLVWGLPEDPMRAALTFFVRFYRFGGRKAAYRILHPWGHRIRYRHDNAAFYFGRLPSVVVSLWPEAKNAIPNLLMFTETMAKMLDGERPEVDYFIAAGRGEKRTYYVDMYPD